MIKKLIANILNKIGFKAICGLAAGLSLFFSTFLWKENKKLSESLEMAQNNIEMYQNALNGAVEQNNVLKLTAEDFKNSNDSLIQEMNKTLKQQKVSATKINTAATQTQNINVTADREVQGASITVNTPSKVYKDSIQFNDLTTVYYIIGEDTVHVALDINNTQYLYTYKHKEWKNKKKFFKRLITLDFKKVWKYKYEILNSNDLINTSDVRVVEFNN